MSTKSKSLKKDSTKATAPIRLDKTDQEIVQRDAGAYYLLVEAIMQNKRLAGEIVGRWLKEKGYVLLKKAEADKEVDRLSPRYKAAGKKAEERVSAAADQIKAREKKLMDLVR